LPQKTGQAGDFTKVVEITPEMVRAGAKALVFDHLSDDQDVALRVLIAALEAGGYQQQQVG
jgi:hypothetical protein